MGMAQLQLRPLSVGDIIDASFTVYRRRFGGGRLRRLVVTLLTVPLSAAVGTVLYVDLRVRKEGLETAELAAQLSNRT